MSIEIYLPKKHENSNNDTKENNDLKKAQELFSGLCNHGNTCYLNSFLQSMFMTPKFRYNVLKFNYDFKTCGPKNECIPYQLQKLFARLQLRLRPAEETKKLTTSFGWSDAQVSEQNDIQELCHVLFDALTYQKNQYISDLFQSIFTTNIKCKECNNISSHDELYIDISLPVKNNNILIESLEKSFECFFSIEELKGDNQYMCENCKKKVDAEKYITVKQLPKILICALNRFEFDYKRGIKKKVNTPLSIPEKIKSLGNFENIEYNLYAIIVHCGSAQSGHYYSLIKNIFCGGENQNKWYKFDDSVVYEIGNIEEYKRKISGNESNLNDNTAYILIYEDSKQNNNDLDFDINKDLMTEIEDEEKEYKKYLEEEKERLSYLNLKIFYNNKYDYIKIKKYEKLITFKDKICNLYGINDVNIEKDTRILIYNLNNNKLINIINPINLEVNNNEKTLEELNITQNHIYHIEIKKPEENFDIFDPDDIVITLVNWDDKFISDIKKNKSATKKKSNENTIEQNGIKIKFNKKMSNDQFIQKIKNSLNYKENENISIHKKQEYGYNNINLITFNLSSDDLKKYLNDDNIILYIENFITNIDDSKFKKYFDSLIPDIKVIFNTPIPEEKMKKIKRISVKDYKFDKSLEICPKFKLQKLKEEISKILNISMDNFIMKKNTHNGVEIKKLEETIDKYSTKNLTVYIQYGIPRKEGDILINFQQYIYDITEFHLYPYKTVDIGFMIFDLNNTINDVINSLKTKNKKFVANNSELTDMKLYLREEKNFKLGKLLIDGNKKLSEINIKEGEVLICQYLNIKNIFYDDCNNSEDKLNIIIRFFDHNNWKISEDFDVFIDKKITTKNFYINIIKKIIEEKKIECSDINEIEGVKISNNEIFYYIDDILKNIQFISFLEYEETSIYNFPFLLNSNGIILLVRYNFNNLREPTVDEINYFYKAKSGDAGAVKAKKKVISSNTKNKTYFKKEVYKEKAMKINVKKFEDLSENNNC